MKSSHLTNALFGVKHHHFALSCKLHVSRAHRTVHPHSTDELRADGIICCSLHGGTCARSDVYSIHMETPFTNRTHRKGTMRDRWSSTLIVWRYKYIYWLTHCSSYQPVGAMMNTLFSCTVIFSTLAVVTYGQLNPGPSRDALRLNSLQETTNWELLEDLFLYHNAIRFFHNSHSIQFNRTVSLRVCVWGWDNEMWGCLRYRDITVPIDSWMHRDRCDNDAFSPSPTSWLTHLAMSAFSFVHSWLNMLDWKPSSLPGTTAVYLKTMVT